jgi:ATP-dependent DNA helicase RecG
MDVFLDRKEYNGDVFTQLENAENFIKNHIKLSSEIKGLQREDQYEIPLEAIRESLVNAVVHRDYSNDGRDINIGIYDDIVNIVSPGGFPSIITKDINAH